jgi:excisionase family DNA binding protein
MQPRKKAPEPKRRKFVTIQEACAVTGTSPRFMRGLIADRKLTAYRLGDRMIRIDLDDLYALLRPIVPGA